MLKKEIEDLKNNASFNEKELEDLKESLQKAKDGNKVLKNLLATTNNKMKATFENLEKQKEDSDHLCAELKQFWKYSLRTQLVICKF